MSLSSRGHQQNEVLQFKTSSKQGSIIFAALTKLTPMTTPLLPVNANTTSELRFGTYLQKYGTLASKTIDIGIPNVC